jgi:hypothetical protein
MSRLPVWVAALWCCSLTVIGFLVVPMLFAHLPTRAMAGGMAAKLFQAQTWVSVLCGLLLLLGTRAKPSLARAPIAPDAVLFIVAGMLLALLSEFAVAPHIVARENLRLWHNVGSAMFVLQCLCAGVVFWKLTPPASGA